MRHKRIHELPAEAGGQERPAPTRLLHLRNQATRAPDGRRVLVPEPSLQSLGSMTPAHHYSHSAWGRPANEVAALTRPSPPGTMIPLRALACIALDSVMQRFRRREVLATGAALIGGVIAARAGQISGGLPWKPNAGSPPRKVEPGAWRF